MIFFLVKETSTFLSLCLKYFPLFWSNTNYWTPFHFVEIKFTVVTFSLLQKQKYHNNFYFYRKKVFYSFRFLFVINFHFVEVTQITKFFSTSSKWNTLVCIETKRINIAPDCGNTFSKVQKIGENFLKSMTRKIF